MTTTLHRAQPAAEPPPPPGSADPAGPGVQVFESVAGFSGALDAIRQSGMTVGLVPTMGALHPGHCSLIERAAAECDVVAVSIFVNPTQFGDASDLANYPRTWDEDLRAVASAGGQVVFAPSVAEMYPEQDGGARTTVSVSALGRRWEGASRPGHFDGVATVVVKLLTSAGRCRAYFGEKDYQQLAVVRRVAADLFLPVEIVGCRTVRDEDGLALSSRNIRLSSDERQAALAISRALRTGATLVERGEDRAAAVEAAMSQVVAEEPLVELDYAVVVHADDLEPALHCSSDGPVRPLIAAAVGPVRLIDNLDTGSVRAFSGRLPAREPAGRTCS
jgi:pantoate--beta-alanine ligase